MTSNTLKTSKIPYFAPILPFSKNPNFSKIPNRKVPTPQVTPPSVAPLKPTYHNFGAVFNPTYLIQLQGHEKGI